MKTDIQDYLLPYLENGKVIIIGITTLNPYSSLIKRLDLGVSYL